MSRITNPVPVPLTLQQQLAEVQAAITQITSDNTQSYADGRGRNRVAPQLQVLFAERARLNDAIALQNTGGGFALSRVRGFGR